MDKDLWQKIQPLMDEALALSVDDRRPWLERVRRESPTIADELEGLLAREGTLDRRGFLDTPLTLGREVVAALTAEGAADRLPSLKGALAGRYTIEARVGRGGMAEVFGAHDVRHGRRVAVKVIRPDASSVLGAERFLAEIRLTAKLTHPNILPLLDSGEVDGALYYVMPFIDGESLRTRMRREGAMPVADALRLVRAVAEALSYAHDEGTVHRDIKPDNILLSGRQAWVADFGIAKAMASSASSHYSATSVGVALGSPGYMAPEQIEGADDVDARADLYSLGVVAWEMLAGKPMFEGKTLQQLFLQHLTVDAPRLDAVRPEVPSGLADVVQRLLAKAPGDRTPSAAALLGELDALGAGSGAHPPLRRTNSLPRLLAVATVLAAGAAWLLLGGGGAEPTIAPLTATGDVGAGILSPDGRRMVYRRNTNLAAVWVREIGDSTSARILVPRLAPGPWGWVDDSTVAVSQRDTLALLNTRTGTVTLPAWSRPGRFTYAGPGLLYRVEGRPSGPGRVRYQRILATGLGDSVAVTLDSGETVLRLLRAQPASPFMVLSRAADSSVRLTRVNEGGARSVVRVVPRSDSSGLVDALGLPGAIAYLSPSGEHLHARHGVDSLLRVDLRRPGGDVERLALPAGGLAPPARDGTLLLRTIEHGGRTWRFPVGDEMEVRGQVIDQIRGDIHLTALDPEGKLLAQVEGITGETNSIHIRSLETGARRKVFTTDRTIGVVHWSPDGTKLAIRTFKTNESQRLAVLDIRDGRLITLGRPPIKPGASFVDGGFPPAWSNDSKHVFAQDFAHTHPPPDAQYTGVIPDAIVRRYALVDGDTGVAIHTHLVSRYRDLPGGELDTLWINGMVVSPDGKYLAVGGSTITVLPIEGGAPRRVVEADTTITWMYPLGWRTDDRIAYATRTSTVGNVGGVFRSFWVPAVGGRPQAAGSIPPACLSINMLANRREASCYEADLRADFVLVRAMR